MACEEIPEHILRCCVAGVSACDPFCELDSRRSEACGFSLNPKP